MVVGTLDGLPPCEGKQRAQRLPQYLYLCLEGVDCLKHIAQVANCRIRDMPVRMAVMLGIADVRTQLR